MTKDLEISVHGTKIRYRDTGGSGPAVLLSHGIGLMLEIWEPAAAALANAGYRVISWDFPGFGRSEIRPQPYSVPFFADFTVAFLDALGLDKVHAVGHSMGGGVAVGVARKHPHRLHSITLNCAAALGREAPFIFKLFTLPGVGKAMTKPSRGGTRQALSSMYKDYSRVTPGLEELWYQYSSIPGQQDVFLQTLKSFTGFGGQNKALVEANLAALPSIRLPALVIAARNDGLIPVSHAERAAKLISGAKLAVIEDCGHLPQLEKAEEFNRLLLDFLGAGSSLGAIPAVPDAGRMGGDVTAVR